ncbi:MAG: hypothetical protein H0W53_03465 [Acidobacteria bacterium]|nr:hypothetical protein [Acidobacteriota bacterium]
MTLNVSLGAGYDDNVLADSAGGGFTDPRRAQGGGFGSGSAQLTYGLNRRRVGLNASAGTSNRYYPNIAGDQVLAAQSGGLGAFIQIAKATRIVASHTTSYQPYLTIGLFPQLFEVPGQVAPASQDLAVEESDYFNHVSSIDLTQALTRKASVSASYSRRSSDFQSADRDFKSNAAGGRFSLSFSRGLAMRLGYGYTDALYNVAGRGAVKAHNIDAGLDLNRPLSFSRRTTIAVSTGSTAIVDGDRTYYRLLANARLNREIGRTWNASLSYARTAGFVESLAGPVFSDAVTLAYGGMVNRRFQFTSSLSASIGEFALVGQGSGFDTYAASLGATYGLSRHMALGVNYSHYRYAFDAGAPIEPGLSRELDRNSVQAYLSMWVPLVHQLRRPDASR